jgi:hypothetical protein
MAESLKVPQAEFEAVIKAMLTTKPLPLSDIRRKSEPKAAATAASGTSSSQEPA